MTQFRIEPVSPTQGDPVTGAFVFSPPPALPAQPRFVVTRDARENTTLGPHGWTVTSRGLRPRRIEKRGQELWVLFGPEVSYHVLADTPVEVRLTETEISGTDIWPRIPRGNPPPAPARGDDFDWPTEGLGEPAAAPPPPPPPPRVVAPVVVTPLPPPPPVVEPPVVEPPVVVSPPPPPSRSWLYAVLALLVVGAVGGGWYWAHRPTPPGPVVVTPPPTPPPAAPCADAAAILARTCDNAALAALPPPEQTRLAGELLRHGGAEANNKAIALLNAATAKGHPPAMLALAKLYDPNTPPAAESVGAANPDRALDLYEQAASGGLAEAGTAREALVGKLKQEAAGTGDAAERAKKSLIGAGVQ